VIQDINNILIIAAHQDDETIGCGGSIKKWHLENKVINLALFTDGSTGMDQLNLYDSITEVRNKELDQVKNILGINKIVSLNEKCQNIQNNQTTFHKVIKLIREYKPDLVITHSNIDKHRDHRIINEIVIEACWKAQENIHSELGKQHKIKDLWAFEITDLLPKVDYVVDITNTYNYKIKAMNTYNSQHNIMKGINNHLKGMALCRGYMIEKMYGEAFVSISKQPVIL
jgi:LmbE family N-acetylglucosaminyl deacetylase